MADMTDKLMDTEAMNFIAKLEDLFKSLPHLPASIVEVLVKIAPYLAILGAILGLIAGPLVVMAGSLVSLLTLNPVLFLVTLVSVILIVANSILMFLAFKPLQDRAMKGWVLMFWAEMISIVSSLLSIFTSTGTGLIGAVVGALIGLYILFEMKPFYGKKA